MKLDRNTLDTLQDAGISLVAGVEGPWGGITVDLEPANVDAFVSDRAEWFARKNGAFKVSGALLPSFHTEVCFAIEALH